MDLGLPEESTIDINVDYENLEGKFFVSGNNIKAYLISKGSELELIIDIDKGKEEVINSLEKYIQIF